MKRSDRQRDKEDIKAQMYQKDRTRILPIDTKAWLKRRETLRANLATEEDGGDISEDKDQEIKLPGPFNQITFLKKTKVD